jgi:hypothetical protein
LLSPTGQTPGAASIQTCYSSTLRPVLDELDGSSSNRSNVNSSSIRVRDGSHLIAASISSDNGTDHYKLQLVCLLRVPSHLHSTACELCAFPPDMPVRGSRAGLSLTTLSQLLEKCLNVC